MQLTAKKETNAMVVTVSGKMDAVTTPEFEKKVSDLISTGERVLLFDFSELLYISSVGLRSILAAAKKLKSDNSRIAFSGLKGAVEEVFKISGFHSIFEIFDSQDTALSSI